jgi:hypothetical protein
MPSTFYISPQTRREAAELAQALGTRIPDDIDVVMWSLPLLVALHDEVRRLRERVEQLEDRFVHPEAQQ